MLAVTFTVVIFGQIYCRNVYSLLIRSSLFGHLDSVILTSLVSIINGFEVCESFEPWLMHKFNFG